MRYIPLTPDEKGEMLAAAGLSSADDLFRSIPEGVRPEKGLKLSPSLSEPELQKKLKEVGGMNTPASAGPTFLGAGAYHHFIPSAVDHLTARSEWYSAYTPYQPEISQGTLQAIYEFQSYICMLTGMEVANASMYDGASALAEAGLMACRVTRKRKLVVSDLVHPRWRQALKSYTQFREIEVTETQGHPHGAVSPEALASAIDDDTAAVIVQSPNFFGNVEDLKAVGELCREKGVLFVTGVAEALSLGMLKPPGDFGADIVIGEGQSFGLAPSYGGPYLGFFATKDKHKRQMPGRLAGRTEDADGKPGFVLTLAAREQHIRREKATSNICTNQALCALRATIYLSLLGKQGMARVAKANLNAAAELREKLKKAKKASPAFNLPFFNEQAVALKGKAAALNRRLAKAGITGGLDLGRFYPGMDKVMLVAVTETATPDDIKKFLKVVEG